MPSGRDPDEIDLLALALDVAKFYGWPLRTVTHETPIHQFWAALDYARWRREEAIRQAGDGPLAPLFALLGMM